MRPRPVIWKPRYATRRMREQAWAKADVRREQAATPSSWTAALRRAAMSFARIVGRTR